MVIHTDIKPFIVAGFVLVLINSSDGHPLNPQAKDRGTGSQGRMVLLKKSCMDSHGNTGICMFKWDCISRQGIALSTCADGFLFGACCSLNEDLLEKWTHSNDFKRTTDNEQMEFYTVPLINNITVNDTRHKTNSSSSQEEDSSNTSLLFKSSSDYSEILGYDRTTTSTDAFTLTGSAININVTGSNNKKIEDFVNNSYEENKNNSHFSYLSEKSTDYAIFDINSLRNQVDSTITPDNISYTSDLELNSEDNGKSKNKLENFTVLNIQNPYIISTLANNKEHIGYSNDSSEFIESWTTSSIMPSENDISENNSFSEMNFHSTQTKNLFDLDSVKTETETSRLVSEVNKSPSIYSTKNLNNEQHNKTKNLSATTAPFEDNKTSIIRQIIPSVWDNDTHVFLPGLQSVISQLTSREASFSKPGVDPTIQSNLTSITSNTGKAGNFDSFLHNNLSDNLKLSFSIPDLRAGEKNNSALEYLNGLKYHQLSGNEQNAHQLHEEVKNSTISYTPDVTSLHFINNDSYLNIPENTVEVKEKSSAGINENNDFGFGVTFDPKIQNSVDESNYILSTNTQQILKVVCNNENNFSKYCDKHDTRSETVPYDNSAISMNSEIVGITQAIQNLNFMTDLLDFNTISDETHKNENNNEIMPIFSQYDKIYVYNQPASSTETYFKTTDSKKDADAKEKLDIKNTFESDEQINVGTDMNISLDVYDSISNSSGNEEFLFDITTDILTYFIKPDHDPSETVQSDFLSTTNEQNFPTKYTEANSLSPSHSHTQETYDSSFQYTLNEIVDDLSSNYPVNASDGNLNQNSSSTLSSSSSFPLKNISQLAISDEEPTNYDLYINNSIPIENFTLNGNLSTEEYFSETTELNETRLNFSINVSNSTSSSVLTSPETHQFDFMNVTQITFTFLDVSQDENASSNNTKTPILNFFQNISNTFSETPSIPYVNNSIHTTENNLLTGAMYNSSNHQTMFQTVDIFNDSDSTNTVLNATNAEIYSSNVTSNSDYLPMSIENFTTVQTTPSHTTKKPTKNNPWNYKRDCGVRPMQPIGRIVGGRNSHFGKWPWQALVKEATWLGIFVKNKCGGVLITSKYVLTAAHCQPGFLASLLVVLGTHDLSSLNDNGIPIIRNVKRMVVHRHYNPQTFENDLALLEMETELEFMPHIVPICLPHRNEDFTGEMAFVTGWGKLTHGGDVPNILQEVQVPIVANNECQTMFYQAGHQKIIQNNFVCAGYTNGGQDSCEGDSGGPLMVQRKDKRWVLVGTVSHGIGCADPNLPGVYMRMSSYRPWIDSIVNK